MSGIDRLRTLAGEWDAYGLGGPLEDIAGQIERERACDADTTENVRLVVGGVIVAVAVVGGVVYAAVRRHKAARDEKKRQMEEILNTPLEKFGDKDVEDLADKYEEEGPISGDKD